ncbi:MFS transporter [Saccharopolyspora sp. K220]|uniref:MFS transporter n=1 Tax=Saccharopolyspora soli TaxID=2926618 RepID=UPI001F5AA19E|nr:MFS transporter [Saccharopolyspora soli]MCI2420883.1 MFS transporter [Saccharopolyspora soli]
MGDPVELAGDSPSRAPTTRTAARPTRVRWKIFILLLGVVALNYVDRGSISVAMPLITNQLHVSKEATGIALSAFFWSYALMQIPGGWLVDKFKPRLMAAISCTGWGIAQALTAVASSLGGLVFFRLLLGAAEAPIYPAGGKLNATWMTPAERGRGGTLLDGGAPLGTAIGGVGISWLIALTGGWRQAFVIAGVATVLVGLFAAWYIRNTPREHPAANAAEIEYVEASHAQEDADDPQPAGRVSLLRYVRYRSFWAMCLGWCGFNGVFYGLLTWGPLYLSETKHFELATIGYSTLVIFGAGFVGELVGGWLADWWRARGASPNIVLRTLLGAAGVFVVLALLGVTYVPNAAVAVAFLSVVMFFLRWAGVYWSVPSILAGRTNAGIMGGAMNLGGNVAGILSPIIVGFIVGATGSYTGALLFFVGCGVLFTICNVTLNYARRLPV